MLFSTTDPLLRIGTPTPHTRTAQPYQPAPEKEQFRQSGELSWKPSVSKVFSALILALAYGYGYCGHCGPALSNPTAPYTPYALSPPDTANISVEQTRLCPR